MSRAVKGTTDEREKFMLDVFAKHYSDPANTKDLSVNKANEIFKAQFGSMLRNKKCYELRAVAKKTTAKTKGAPTNEVTQAARKSDGMVVAPGGPGAAALITGTPDQLTYLKSALNQLTDAGLVTGKVDHSAGGYVVVAQV